MPRSLITCTGCNRAAEGGQAAKTTRVNQSSGNLCATGSRAHRKRRGRRGETISRVCRDLSNLRVGQAIGSANGSTARACDGAIVQRRRGPEIEGPIEYAHHGDDQDGSGERKIHRRAALSGAKEPTQDQFNLVHDVRVIDVDPDPSRSGKGSE